MNSAKGLFTGTIRLDLQKAFDTVDHSILCSKLKLMGVDSTKWLKSYLSNRSQLVNVGKINSDIANVTCGVPQGSILGPLHFMVISIDPSCKLLSVQSCLLTNISIKLIINSDKFSNPAQNGLLIINCHFIWGKTECILFGSKRKLRKVKVFHIVCNDRTTDSKTAVTLVLTYIICR